MSISNVVKQILPNIITNSLRRGTSVPSRSRTESNRWLRRQCKDIQGDVLSIGSGNDSDREGKLYRDYFSQASSYTTSEVSEEFNSDLVVDVRSMPEIEDEVYDCIFCSGVLEHVDDFHAGLNEITRILKTDGILLLGTPFRQAIHLSPQDFWRFTEHGVRFLLKESYQVIDLVSIDSKKGMEFPSAYWVKAKKKRKS